MKEWEFALLMNSYLITVRTSSGQKRINSAGCYCRLLSDTSVCFFLLQQSCSRVRHNSVQHDCLVPLGGVFEGQCHDWDSFLNLPQGSARTVLAKTSSAVLFKREESKGSSEVETGRGSPVAKRQVRLSRRNTNLKADIMAWVQLEHSLFHRSRRWKKTALTEATVHSWNISLLFWRCEGKKKNKTHPPGRWDGVAAALSSSCRCPPGLWSHVQQFNLGLSCGKEQRGLTVQSPLDSRCRSRDLPIPGQHSCLSGPPTTLLPRSVHALSPATPSGAVCPAAPCSNGRSVRKRFKHSLTTPATLIKKDRPSESCAVCHYANPQHLPDGE